MNATPAGPYPPTNELVAVAWLSQRVPELIGLGIVATTLPKDTSKWTDTGFVQARSVVGGIPNIDIPLRRPVIQLDTWACSSGSNKPSWNLANRLVELIRIETEEMADYNKAVTLPDGYNGAIVGSAYFINEPRRVNDDPSGYARFTVDLAINWTYAP